MRRGLDSGRAEAFREATAREPIALVSVDSLGIVAALLVAFPLEFFLFS